MHVTHNRYLLLCACGFHSAHICPQVFDMHLSAHWYLFGAWDMVMGPGTAAMQLEYMCGIADVCMTAAVCQQRTVAFQPASLLGITMHLLALLRTPASGVTHGLRAWAWQTLSAASGSMHCGSTQSWHAVVRP